jgi:hypothetical protein
MTFPRILLPVAGLPGPFFSVSGPHLGAGQSGDPAPLFLPLLGGASTRDAADQRRAQAERLDRRMRHLDAVPQWCSEGEMPTATVTTEGPYMRPASNNTARPAVLPRLVGVTGGAPGRKLAPQPIQKGKAWVFRNTGRS